MIFHHFGSHRVGVSGKRRFEVWLKALYLTAAYLAFIYFSHLLLLLRLRSRPLAWILAFVLAHSLMIGAILLASLFRKALQGINSRRARRVQSLITEQLASHGAGLDRIAQLSGMQKKYPRETELCLMELIPSVSAESRDRLSHLAVTLGLVSSWRSQYRSQNPNKRREAIARLSQLSGAVVSAALLSSLSDSDELVRLEACRGLARNGTRREVEKVFSFSLSQPLLARVILAHHFRSHAPMLCEGAVPEALASADSQRVVAVLEMMESWGTMLPLPGFTRMLRHSDPAVRAAAFRVLPCITGVAGVEKEVLESLHETDPRVRAAAAFVAGRFGLRSAVPVLASCLHASEGVVTLSAAYALAQIEPTGPEVLENEILLSRGSSAAASLEALEKSRIQLSGMAPFR